MAGQGQTLYLNGLITKKKNIYLESGAVISKLFSHLKNEQNKIECLSLAGPSRRLPLCGAHVRCLFRVYYSIYCNYGTRLKMPSRDKQLIIRPIRKVQRKRFVNTPHGCQRHVAFCAFKAPEAVFLVVSGPSMN